MKTLLSLWISHFLQLFWRHLFFPYNMGTLLLITPEDGSLPVIIEIHNEGRAQDKPFCKESVSSKAQIGS